MDISIFSHERRPALHCPGDATGRNNIMFCRCAPCSGSPRLCPRLFLRRRIEDPFTVAKPETLSPEKALTLLLKILRDEGRRGGFMKSNIFSATLKSAVLSFAPTHPPTHPPTNPPHQPLHVTGRRRTRTGSGTKVYRRSRLRTGTASAPKVYRRCRLRTGTGSATKVYRRCCRLRTGTGL